MTTKPTDITSIVQAVNEGIQCIQPEQLLDESRQFRATL